MLQGALYDLMVAPPHEPADARFTAADFALYREGYDHALLVALKAIQSAAQRYELIERTKRLEARRKRAHGALGIGSIRRGR